MAPIQQATHSSRAPRQASAHYKPRPRDCPSAAADYTDQRPHVPCVTRPTSPGATPPVTSPSASAIPDPPGRWSQIELAGHPCDWYDPPTPHPQGYTVIYLHGVHLQRLVDHRAFTVELARHGLRCCAPHTQRSWWSNRICHEFDPQVSAEQHVRQRVLDYLAQQHQTHPPRIALLGTSMGGQGALRLAFKFPNQFPVVAAISPAIDYQSRLREGDETLYEMYGDEETARQDTATLHVHPLNWPRHIWFCCDPSDARWHESAERLRSKLYSLGIPHMIDLETTGGGHSFEYYNRQAPAALAFIIERLEQERLRVV